MQKLIRKSCEILTSLSLTLLISNFCYAFGWQANDTGSIQKFEMKYKFNSSKGTRSVVKYFFVGTIQPDILINSKYYRRFVFGEDSTKSIALIRQDNNSLDYINLPDIQSTADTLGESPFLYFNRNVNETWFVHIDSSLFWNCEVTFMGIESNEIGDRLYVYSVYSVGTPPEANKLSKLYYSKEKGFVKFEISTHWFPVEVTKFNQSEQNR